MSRAGSHWTWDASLLMIDRDFICCLYGFLTFHTGYPLEGGQRGSSPSLNPSDRGQSDAKPVLSLRPPELFWATGLRREVQG